MMLAMPVSSSSERKTNPLAVPGRCRAITHPAIWIIDGNKEGILNGALECQSGKHLVRSQLFSRQRMQVAVNLVNSEEAMTRLLINVIRTRAA